MRSGRWFGGADLAGFIHRSSIHAEGISRAALAGRPVVGVCNSWSELVSCNLHFRSLAEAVKRGVLLVGGLPLEFPAIALGENLMKPTTMLFRNLMSMDVEECIRAYPFDAVVLIGGCDKTIPAQLMGAASADVPAIMVTGGSAEAAWFRGRPLAGGTDLWHYADELRAGRMTEEEFAELEAAATPSFGHCNEMGTASTMSDWRRRSAWRCRARRRSRPSTLRGCARPRRPAGAPLGSRRSRSVRRPCSPRRRSTTRSRFSPRSAAARTPSCTCSHSQDASACRSGSPGSTSSPRGPRSSSMSARPAITWSRTCTAPAACRACSRSSRRCCTSRP